MLEMVNIHSRFLCHFYSRFTDTIYMVSTKVGPLFVERLWAVGWLVACARVIDPTNVCVRARARDIDPTRPDKSLRV